MMPQLPRVEKLSRNLLQSVQADPNGLFRVDGPPAAGKSALLWQLRDMLRGTGRLPILVDPPAGELDSGAWALVQLGGALHEQQVINGELEYLLDPHNKLEAKLHRTQSWVAQASTSLVLLLDEPATWPASNPEDASFAEHTERVVQSLIRLPCARIITGALPLPQPASRAFELEGLGDAAGLLRDQARWGVLSRVASELADQGGDRLSRCTPLQVGLLVGIAALSPKAIEALLNPQADLGLRHLGHTFAVQLWRDLPHLCTLWSKVCLERRSFTSQLLRDLQPPRGPQPGRELDLVTRCLLIQQDDRYVLHDALKAVMRQFQIEHNLLGRQEQDDVHRLLANYNRRLLELESGADEDLLLIEMEAYHHASGAGDVTLLDGRAFFVEQLDALGRNLSLAKRNEDSVRVFRRSLSLDPDDDYAHHYLAYNLDIMAENPEESEQHYRNAIRLSPLNPWWRSRLITFLITLGRTSEAHVAWNEALEAFGLPCATASPTLYENLNLWVARLLLRRSQLDFAETVLSVIPRQRLAQSPRLQALDRRLKALQAARRGECFFPLHIPLERAWGRPQLSSMRRGSVKLALWLAGRVEAKDSETLSLRVAQPPPKDAAPQIWLLDLPRDDFDRWSQDDRFEEMAEGRFIEIAYYGEEDEPVIRVHPPDLVEDVDLPPFFPDPLRYLRKEGWVSGRERST